MKLIHLLLAVLVSLLVIILLLAILPPIPGATGAYHPEIDGMFIGPTSIDSRTDTKWLGYLFGVGIIALFGTLLFIGNRKLGKVTCIGRWLWVGILTYAISFSLLTFSNWSYGPDQEDAFFWFLPKPTAWMIFAVWFSPAIITIAYVALFESAVFSPEEEEEFQLFLQQQKVSDGRD